MSEAKESDSQRTIKHCLQERAQMLLGLANMDGVSVRDQGIIMKAARALENYCCNFPQNTPVIETNLSAYILWESAVFENRIKLEEWIQSESNPENVSDTIDSIIDEIFIQTEAWLASSFESVKHWLSFRHNLLFEIQKLNDELLAQCEHLPHELTPVVLDSVSNLHGLASEITNGILFRRMPFLTDKKSLDLEEVLHAFVDRVDDFTSQLSAYLSAENEIDQSILLELCAVEFRQLITAVRESGFEFASIALETTIRA